MTGNKISKIVRFAPRGKNSFFDIVNAKIRSYFETNRISQFANMEMWTKSIIMLSLYFAPYVVMVTGVLAGNFLAFIGLWFLMALGMVGIGTSVMHDANHGAFSKHAWINNLIGNVLNLIGGYTITWKIQHNVLHHTYTNILGYDEDIQSIPLLRFSPTQKRRWYHQYQHIYAWFFYSLMTLNWMTIKDYVSSIKYNRKDLLKKYKVSLKQAILKITYFKVFYYTYILVLPLIFSGMPWYSVIIGFLIMHFTAGLFLSCIFQPAHVMDDMKFALPREANGELQIDDTWAVHEVLTTTNFAPRNRLLSWYIGGLNYQIEHHLAPGVCHVHYPKLSPIVRNAIEEYGLPYHVKPTFTRALIEHGKMLKKLGKE